jgi:hypothetical protein
MAKAKSLYSVHPSFRMEAGYAAKLKERTGKTLAEWVTLTLKEGPPDEKARRAWLEDTHGITKNYTWWIVEKAAGRGGAEQYDPDRCVEDMFAKRPALRPIYDRMLAIALGLGKDVKACPCKTIVPLYREHVFAELKPATKTRLELGLALRGEPFTDRLKDTGGTARGDRLTHRIDLTTLDDIDVEALLWLRTAYERDAGAKPPGKKAK